MKWTLEKERSVAAMSVEYTLKFTIPDDESINIHHNQFTRLLERECNDSDLLSDKLLYLEHIIRKLEEAG